MPVPQIRSTTAASKPSSSGASAADLKTATKLKGSINEVLMRVRFGNPLTPAQSPVSNTKGEWQAPNGDRLVRVALATPPAGSADMMSRTAFVNPKTNQFYEATFGGIAGLRSFHGPLALPAGTQFKGKTFGAKDIAALTHSANVVGQGNHAIPGKTTILNALGTYEFHKLIKYGTKAPAAADVLKKVPLKKDNFPDGYTYTGLVLKSDPSKVIIQRSGGLAGLSTYSQTIDVTRLPK